MTLDDYRELVGAYNAAGLDDEDRIRWTLLNTKVFSFAEKIGKSPVEWETEDLYKFFTEGILLSTSTIINYLTTFGSFYDYAISRGIISSNPCNSAILTSKKILAASKMRRGYFTDEDIDTILKSIVFNPDLNTAVLLTYYEGVAMNATDLGLLKTTDLHRETETIDIKMGSKKISHRLTYAYVALAGVDVVDGDKPSLTRTTRRRTKAFKAEPDDLFPTTGGMKELFYNRRLKIIGDTSGYHLNCLDLYYSGFLNFVAGKVGRDHCIEIVFGNTYAGYNELCDYANEYLFPVYLNKIRGILRGTAMAMRDKI